MLPEYPQFKPLEIEDLIDISAYLKQINPTICELAPANLLIWKDFDNPKITVMNENLCILISPLNEPPFFMEPVGNNKTFETAKACLKHAGRLSRISKGFVKQFSESEYRVSCLRGQCDYLYETKTLAELKGRKYDGKRNHLKKFGQHFPEYEYVPMELSFKSAALKLFDEWFESKKGSRFFPKLAYTSQKKALEKTFLLFEKINLVGGAILFKNEMKGFILGSPLNKNTVSVHFQYGQPATQGISQVLLWEACRKSFAPFTYTNLEQDLGIPGLRKAKLSYYPLRLEEKFEIRPI